MSAVVTREERAPRYYVAWCEECQDGIRMRRPGTPESWADGHNAARHLRELEAAVAVDDVRPGGPGISPAARCGSCRRILVIGRDGFWVHRLEDFPAGLPIDCLAPAPAVGGNR